MATGTSLQTKVGGFGPDDLGSLSAFFTEHGFAVLTDLRDGARMDAVEDEGMALQETLEARKLDGRHGNTVLADTGGGCRPATFANYVLGWRSGWHNAPHLDGWPSVAFTIHIDATSPANGFLTVVPGSHLGATPARFRNANGVAVPAYLWQPTAGATDEEGIRRHRRGGWFSGPQEDGLGARLDDFVRNAAR